VWELVRRQHGVVSRSQLFSLGFSADAIEHRIAVGRLHRLWKGVYAVGRPDVGRYGQLTAAVLSCGPQALVSHGGAGWLWGIVPWDGQIDVVVPYGVARRRRDIHLHRRLALDPVRIGRVVGIPVTDPVDTIIDLASDRSPSQLARVVREADRLDLVDPEGLRAALDRTPRRPGIGRLRSLLDSETFALTDSELERRFLRLVHAAALPQPETQVQLNGICVDFYWRELGLVVETDGLRYHRTPSQQNRDLQRDQAHAAAGLTSLRFSASQVRFEPERTVAALTAVTSRLRSSLKDRRAYGPGDPSTNS
jgi:very-short-patch-repair endonuclease